MAKVATVQADLIADAGQLIGEFKKAAQATTKLSGTMTTTLKVAGATTVAILGAISGRAIAEFIKSQQQAAQELANTSKRLGVATDALAGFKLGAEIAGVSFSAMTTGLQRQSRRISEAARGTGAAVDAIDELGLSAQELIQLSPDKQFLKLAEAFDGITNASERSRLQQKIWETEFASVVNLIDLGVPKLEELSAEVRKSGAAFNDWELDQVVAAQGAVTRAKNAVEGFRNSVLLALSPFIKLFADKFREAAVETDGFRTQIVGFAFDTARVLAFTGDIVRGLVGLVTLLGRALYDAFIDSDGVILSFANFLLRLNPIVYTTAAALLEAGSAATEFYAASLQPYRILPFVKGMQEDLLATSGRLGELAEAQRDLANEPAPQLKSIGQLAGLEAGENALAAYFETIKQGLRDVIGEDLYLDRLEEFEAAFLASMESAGFSIRDNYLPAVDQLVANTELAMRRAIIAYELFGDGIQTNLAQARSDLEVAFARVAGPELNAGQIDVGPLLAGLDLVGDRAQRIGEVLQSALDVGSIGFAPLDFGQVDVGPLLDGLDLISEQAQRTGESLQDAFDSESLDFSAIDAGQIDVSPLLDELDLISDRAQRTSEILQDALDLDPLDFSTLVVGQVDVDKILAGLDLVGGRAQLTGEAVQDALAFESADLDALDVGPLLDGLTLVGDQARITKDKLTTAFSGIETPSVDSGPLLASLDQIIVVTSNTTSAIEAGLSGIEAPDLRLELDGTPFLGTLQRSASALVAFEAQFSSLKLSLDPATEADPEEALKAAANQRRSIAESVIADLLEGERFLGKETTALIDKQAKVVADANLRQSLAGEIGAEKAATAILNSKKLAAEVEKQVGVLTTLALKERDRLESEFGKGFQLLSKDQFQEEIVALAEQVTQSAQDSANIQKQIEEQLNADILAGRQGLSDKTLELVVAAAEQQVLAEAEAARAARAALGVTEAPDTEEGAEQILEKRKKLEDAVTDATRDALRKRTQLEAKAAKEKEKIIKAVQKFEEKSKAALLGLAFELAGQNKKIGKALFLFEKGKAIGEAIMATKVAYTAALKISPAYAARVAALGIAQVAGIAATTISGLGGGGGGSYSAGAPAPVSSTVADTSEQEASDQSADRVVQVIFQGDVFGWDDFMQDRVITSLREALDDRDVVLFSNNSRQALEVLAET